MASVIVAPGAQIDADDFWVASGAVSNNERFAHSTGRTTSGALGLSETRATYTEYQFVSGDTTYRYVGNWELTTKGLVTGTVSAHGVYDQVILERNGVVVATLTTDAPMSVDLGSKSGINLLGLGDLLNPTLELLLGGAADKPAANLHLLATPNLPDLAGIPDDFGAPETSDEGTTGNDTIAGSPGEDNISGLEGNDRISGGSGDDTLYGNQGDDNIDGGAGQDLVHGGQDDDTVAGGEGNDLIYGGLGSDSVKGNAGDDVIYGGNQSSDPTDDVDTIYGGQGADNIFGNGGADLIYGGDGLGDLTDSGDIIYGGRGDDTIFGNAGNDTIYGQRGSDKLYGDGGNDWLHGGQENDAVSGGSGNDTVNGGLGNDILTGGLGTDTFVFESNQGNDVVIDFNFLEGDRLDLKDQDFSLGATEAGFVELTLSGSDGIVLQGILSTSFSTDFIL